MQNKSGKIISGVAASLIMVFMITMVAFAGKTSVLNVSELANTTITSNTTYGNFTVYPDSDGTRISNDSKSVNGMSFSKKMTLLYGVREGGGSIHFTISSPAQLSVACMTSNSSTNRFLGIYRASNNQMLYSFSAPNGSLKLSELRLTDPGEYYLASTSGKVEIYYVSVAEEGGSQPSTETPTDPPTEAPTDPPATEYIGDINTELQDFRYDENTHYLSGQIVVVEWVDTNGDGQKESTVPSCPPTMVFASTDGTDSIEVFVTPTGTNTYYFDRLLGDSLPAGKEYVFYVTSGNELNVGPYRTNCVYTGNSGIGTEGRLGRLKTQVLSFKTAADGRLTLYAGPSDEKYEGAVNSVLTNVSCTKSQYGSFVSGNIVITEWVNGESVVPATTPTMSFESADGEQVMDVFMASVNGTNTYYFDRNLSEEIDVTKEYVFRISLTEPNNVSTQKTMFATTNYMDAKEGTLWETDTQIVKYKTVWAHNDNELRVYAVNK